MPRNLINWTYKDVVAFLKQHFFKEVPSGRTGHNFFKGFINNEYKLVEVQFHSGGKTISPRSLQHDIIPKSGIPQSYWKHWANAGNNRLKKQVQYQKATKW